jgi:P-type Mg2+ transporter
LLVSFQIVSLSVVAKFIQTFRSLRATSRLRKVEAPTATVLRDGVFSDVPRSEVVPGDIIRVRAGDLVPANARLLDARDCHVQQSAFTGEPMPVEKEFKEDDETDAAILLLGTSVMSGTATALVLATDAENGVR